MDNLGLDALFDQAEDPAWQALMQRAQQDAPVSQTIEPEVYAALFSSKLGRQVLADMYARYVNVTRCVPGQGADAAFYREGMAQVVFDIVLNITVAKEAD